jgi:hypothetical protein
VRDPTGQRPTAHRDHGVYDRAVRDPGHLRRFTAAYRGGHDPLDALWWRQHPDAPSPSGAPALETQLRELRAALYRPAASERLPLELAALAGRIRAEQAAVDSALSAAERGTGSSRLRAAPLLAVGGGLAVLAGWAVAADAEHAVPVRRIEYALSGSALDAAYTWRLPDRVVRREAVELPVVPNGPRFGTRFRARSGTPLSIQATKTGTAGDLTCLIAADGVLLSVRSTAADHGSVHCSARVP